MGNNSCAVPKSQIVNEILVWHGNCSLKSVTKSEQAFGETIDPRFQHLAYESPRIKACSLSRDNPTIVSSRA